MKNFDAEYTSLRPNSLKVRCAAPPSELSQKAF